MYQLGKLYSLINEKSRDDEEKSGKMMRMLKDETYFEYRFSKEDYKIPINNRLNF